MNLNDSAEKTGVFVEKCEFDNNLFVCQPTIAVDVVNSVDGESLLSLASLPTTKPFNVFKNRSQVPQWNEMVACPTALADVININSEVIFFFELCDEQEPQTSMFQRRRKDAIKVRIAWAFLKVISSNGSLNVGKSVKLQLFKVRKKCSVSHQTCPLFHLYSAHKRKKIEGSLLLKIQGITASSEKSNDTIEGVKIQLNKSAAMNKVEETINPSNLISWSRLPTQSCKVPNEKMAELRIGKHGVTCLSFSHAGLSLACGSTDRIVVFNVFKSKEHFKLLGHSGLIYEVSWSHDDNLLASVSADSSAIIWGIKPLTKSPLYVLPHLSFVYCGKWFHKEHQLVTGGKDCTLRCWGMNNKEFNLREELVGHEGFITALETMANGGLLSGDSRGHIHCWNFVNNRWTPIRKIVLKEESNAVVDVICVHPGQRRILVTPRLCDPIAIDLGTGVVIQTFQCPQPTARSHSCLSPCGELVFSMSCGHIVNVWQFQTGKHIAAFNEVFSFIDSKRQLSGCMVYHPHDHIVAFALHGDNCPLLLLQYNKSKQTSNHLGLVIPSVQSITSESRTQMDAKPAMTTTPYGNEDTTEEKLAALIRQIDTLFKTKNIMKRRMSSYDPMTS